MCLSVALGDRPRTGKCAESASVFHRLETTMHDPTIPELVARLRELHEKATPGPWSTNHRGGDISARIRGHEVQVALACGQGALWDERDDAAASMRPEGRGVGDDGGASG